MPELGALSAVLACVADDNFDWATATGTWMVDIYAPWSVIQQQTMLLQQHRHGSARHHASTPTHHSPFLGLQAQLQIELSPASSSCTLTATPAKCVRVSKHTWYHMLPSLHHRQQPQSQLSCASLQPRRAVPLPTCVTGGKEHDMLAVEIHISTMLICE